MLLSKTTTETKTLGISISENFRREKTNDCGSAVNSTDNKITSEKHQSWHSVSILVAMTSTKPSIKTSLSSTRRPQTRIQHNQHLQ
jgi:plasmid rolling circle replication initiator protein Rep